MTVSFKCHESCSITIVQRAVTATGDDVARLSPLFPSDVIEGP
jgi:hypothetical protein